MNLIYRRHYELYDAHRNLYTSKIIVKDFEKSYIDNSSIINIRNKDYRARKT